MIHFVTNIYINLVQFLLSFFDKIMKLMHISVMRTRLVNFELIMDVATQGSNPR